MVKTTNHIKVLIFIGVLIFSLMGYSSVEANTQTTGPRIDTGNNTSSLLTNPNLPKKSVEEELEELKKRMNNPDWLSDYIDSVLTDKYGTTKPNAPTIATRDMYSFTASGELIKQGASDTSKNLFEQILKEKQGAVIVDINRVISSELMDTTINGGIYTDSESLWNPSYNMNKWKDNRHPTVIYMEAGNMAYKIQVPQGVTAGGKKVNQKEIQATINAVEKYKDMVKESVYVGLLAESFNVYNIVPDRQVVLADILEFEKKNGGGVYKIKSSGTGVKIIYTLKEFYHPISGKVTVEQLGQSQDSIKSFIRQQYKNINLQVGASKEKVNFILNEGFTSFYSDYRSNSGLYTKVTNTSAVTANGVKSYRTTYNRKEVLAQSVLDSTVPLALPYTFVNTATNYQLSASTGYRIDENISFLLSTMNVYKKEDSGEKTILGDFKSFGIDLNGVALTSLPVDKNGNLSSNEKSRRIGVIVPLWFKETILNTSSISETVNQSFYTGRVIKFNNDYNSKTRLDDVNRDLVAFDTKLDGRKGIPLRYFAFPPGSDVKDKNNHMSLGQKPESFTIHTRFESSTDADYRGFIIYRNNYYLTADSELKSWLTTQEAKAMEDVEAETLLKLLEGEITLGKEELSYEKWVRMQEIRGELDSTARSKLVSAVNILTIVFGYIIIVYSIFLCIAYWFDIVNTFMDFSLLQIVTGGRLYSIPNKESLDYTMSYVSTSDNVKFVTFWHVFIIMLVGVFIGLIFIFVSPIWDFIVWLYYFMGDITGVV